MIYTCDVHTIYGIVISAELLNTSQDIFQHCAAIKTNRSAWRIFNYDRYKISLQIECYEISFQFNISVFYVARSAFRQVLQWIIDSRLCLVCRLSRNFYLYPWLFDVITYEKKRNVLESIRRKTWNCTLRYDVNEINFRPKSHHYTKPNEGYSKARGSVSRSCTKRAVLFPD